MKLVFDIIDKVNDDRRFILCGHFVPEDAEKELYAGMVETQASIASAYSVLRVKDNTLILDKIAIADCKSVLDTFKRNFEIDFTFSLAKSAVVNPKGSESLVKMELGL